MKLFSQQLASNFCIIINTQESASFCWLDVVAMYDVHIISQTKELSSRYNSNVNHSIPDQTSHRLSSMATSTGTAICINIIIFLITSRNLIQQ